ncbi:MAG: phage terminase small subunit [Lachnospiraceae bacterium]|nr:phage terminase small subunit [Lachnospiraceae bacterium]
MQKNSKKARARKLYEEQGMSLKDIADKIGAPPSTVRGWKSRGNWVAPEIVERRTGQKPNIKTNTEKRGFQDGNSSAVLHGLRSKYLPPETLEIVDSLESASQLDILALQIKMAFASYVRAQKIMYVADKDDKTKEIISAGVAGESYKIDEAYEKQANFLNASARIMAEIRSMIKQYDEMVHKEWNLESEKQHAEIDLIKSKISEGTEEKAVTAKDWKAALLEAYKDRGEKHE